MLVRFVIERGLCHECDWSASDQSPGAADVVDARSAVHQDETGHEVVRWRVPPLREPEFVQLGLFDAVV